MLLFLGSQYRGASPNRIKLEALSKKGERAFHNCMLISTQLCPDFMAQKNKGKQSRHIGKRILIIICIIAVIFAVGYSIGIIPEKWITSAETFLNFGKPMSDSLNGSGKDLLANLKEITEYGYQYIFSGESSAVAVSSAPAENHGASETRFPKDGTHDGWDGDISDISEYEETSPCNLTLRFIDVGQADCTLIQSGTHTMLVDGGNISDGPLVVEYLRSIGVEHLEYVVGTHAHEDHIGGLDDILSELQVDMVMLPYTTTNPNGTYTYLKNAAKYADVPTIFPEAGRTYELGDAKWTILSCDYAADETNENEYSIVIMVTYGATKFLLMGDAEIPNEQAILASGYDVTADVLRIGHHGSTTSSCQEFLDAVNPKAAIISVGLDNEYFHPAPSTISRIDDHDIAIMRTDQDGTIIATSDGINIQYSKQKTRTNG